MAASWLHRSPKERRSLAVLNSLQSATFSSSYSLNSRSPTWAKLDWRPISSFSACFRPLFGCFFTGTQTPQAQETRFPVSNYVTLGTQTILDLVCAPISCTQTEPEQFAPLALRRLGKQTAFPRLMQQLAPLSLSTFSLNFQLTLVALFFTLAEGQK